MTLLVPLVAHEVDHDLYRFDWPEGSPHASTYGDDSDLELLRARARKFGTFFDVIPLEDP